MSAGRNAGVLVSGMLNAKHRVPTEVPEGTVAAVPARPVVPTATLRLALTTGATAAATASRSVDVVAQTPKPTLPAATTASKLRTESSKGNAATPVRLALPGPVAPPNPNRSVVDLAPGLPSSLALIHTNPLRLAKEAKVDSVPAQRSPAARPQSGALLRSSLGSTPNSLAPEAPPARMSQQFSYINNISVLDVETSNAVGRSLNKPDLPKWILKSDTMATPSQMQAPATSTLSVQAAAVAPSTLTALKHSGIELDLKRDGIKKALNTSKSLHAGTGSPLVLTRNVGPILPSKSLFGIKKVEMQKPSLVSELLTTTGTGIESDAARRSMSDDLVKILGAVAASEVFRLANATRDIKSRQSAVDVVVSEQLLLLKRRYSGRQVAMLLANHLEMADAINKDVLADWSQVLGDYESKGKYEKEGR